jgi:hypothetical protein
MPEVFRRVRPGAVLDRETARTLNAMQEALEALLSPRGGGETGVRRLPGGMLLEPADEPPDRLWVQLGAGPVSPGRYESWTEVTADDTGYWSAADDGLAGSTNFPAFVPDGWPDPATGTVVPAVFGEDEESLVILTPGVGTSGDITISNANYTFDTTTSVTFLGLVSLLGGVQFGVEHVTWGADQNPFTPQAGTVFLIVDNSTSGDLTLKTLAGGVDGRPLWIHNVDPSNDLILADETSGFGSTSDQMRLPGGVDFTLTPGCGFGLVYDGTDMRWTALDGTAGGSPLTTKGDIWVFGTTDTRLPAGTDGQVLKADSAQTTGLSWAPASPLTTKGDLFGFSTANDRLSVGSNGQVLTADSTQATGIKWASASAVPTFSGARVYHNNNQTLTNGVPVQFNSERFDTDNYHSTVSNTSRLTAPTDGYYLIGACLYPFANPTGFAYIAFIVNRAVTGQVTIANSGIQAPNAAFGRTQHALETVYKLNAGDFVEVIWFSGSSSDLIVTSFSTSNHTPEFWITRLGT